MNPALDRGAKKALRTLVQLAASGALTAAVTALSGGLSPTTGTLVAAGWLFVVTFLQNTLETAGKIPVLLPTAGIVPVAVAVGGIASTVGGTVEAVADELGDVTGTVTDMAGDVSGTVVGGVTGVVGKVVGATKKAAPRRKPKTEGK